MRESKSTHADYDADAFRRAVIKIQNVSAVDLTVADCSLMGGEWEKDYEPKPGHNISAGDIAEYRNITQRPFTDIGGFLKCNPANGGVMYVSWEWEEKKEPSGNAYIQNTSALALEYQGVLLGNTFTLQVIVKNNI